MSYQKNTSKEDSPPRYSMDDCPPGYYDIYPHECIPLSSLAKATPPNNVPPPPPPTTSTTTSTTNNNNTVTPSVPSNGNAVVSQPSSSQYQPRNNESQEETWIAYILWKLLVILSIIALIIIPLVGLHAVIWSCISYHQRHNLGPFGKAALKIAIILCIVSYAVILFVVLILLTVFVFANQ